MQNKSTPTAFQSAEQLQKSASLAEQNGEETHNAICVAEPIESLAMRINRIGHTQNSTISQTTCEQHLSFCFFFDGTGNNMQADEPTEELSNVARLYLAHLESDPTKGIYKFYIPGIGTRFKKIGDPGGTTAGLAFGADGEKRLKWALLQFEDTLAIATAFAANPKNKIASVKISAFGFSRGATLARAFARDFQGRCIRSSSSWTLKDGGYAIRFCFLGLWDTVASVGLPMSANNTSLAQSMSWINVASAMQARSDGPNGPNMLAFGQFADPAPGLADGHSSWAHPLDVASMVEKCVHMVAAHETRNSFPLDSCRRGTNYPENTIEMVYPGSHSDVGGGYRPGENARSLKPGQMLNVLPLRAMHRIATQYGVPLRPLSMLSTDYMTNAFATSPECKPEFERLTEHWKHYMLHANPGPGDLGKYINSHMRLFYAWRFYKIHQNQAARLRKIDTQEQSTLKKQEELWKKEKLKLEEEMINPKKQYEINQTELIRAQNRLDAAEQRKLEYGTTVEPSLKQEVEQARTQAEAASEKYLPLKARYDTLPSCDGSLARNMQAYDDQLMADAHAIRMTLLASPDLHIRPHYRNLLDAYEAEFIHSTGLCDEKIIEFFDTYIHDSLPGFSMDATLPSDPRVVYIGDNNKSRHASNPPSMNEIRRI